MNDPVMLYNLIDFIGSEKMISTKVLIIKITNLKYNSPRFLVLFFVENSSKFIFSSKPKKSAFCRLSNLK